MDKVLRTSYYNSVPLHPPPSPQKNPQVAAAIDLECFDPRMLFFLVTDQKLKGRN